MASIDKTLQLLNHIGNELKLLWVQLDAYQELFLVEQERRQSLLEDTAPGFFAIVQVSLAESFLMRVFRLMDGAKSCGEENSSFQNLHGALGGSPPERQAVQQAIGQVRAKWKDADGPYSALLVLRNKLLAHNDFSKRSAMSPNQLGMNLSSSDFASAQGLAGRMWDLYRQGKRALCKTDVIEPTHSSLANRPSVVMRHLCASQYLDRLIDESSEHQAALSAFEHERMGNDRMRTVFRTVSGG